MTDDSLPRDFAGLRALIVKRAADMPKRLRQVAAFAIEKPDDLAFGTVVSIAQSADVQPSALIRFSQALGYQGFSDLQDVFRNRLRDRVLDYDERLQQLREHPRSASTAVVIFDGIIEASFKSMMALQEKLDASQLDKAVDMLARAECIYLIGLRRSFPISTYMSYAYGKLAIRHVLVDAIGGLAPEDVSFATPRDCVLAVSFTPYASETVALVQAAHRKKVPVVAITDSPFSPLAPVATTCFEVQEGNFDGFRSMAATMALAMTLTVAVAEKRSNKRET